MNFNLASRYDGSIGLDEKGDSIARSLACSALIAKYPDEFQQLLKKHSEQLLQRALADFRRIDE